MILEFVGREFFSWWYKHHKCSRCQVRKAYQRKGVSSNMVAILVLNQQQLCFQYPVNQREQNKLYLQIIVVVCSNLSGEYLRNWHKAFFKDKTNTGKRWAWLIKARRWLQTHRHLWQNVRTSDIPWNIWGLEETLGWDSLGNWDIQKQLCIWRDLGHYSQPRQNPNQDMS